MTLPLDDDLSRLRADVERHYGVSLGKHLDDVDIDYLYEAVARAVRDRLVLRWKNTQKAHLNADRRVYYLSLEFLMGRALGNAIHALDLEDSVTAALLDYSHSLEAVAAREEDAGLGNGGLGRLAACFLDSCATMELPVMGYGIRYEYGMFHQRIENGQQVEYPDHWLRDGNAWEFERPEDTRRVRFGGHTEVRADPFHVVWLDTQDVMAVPYDVPIPGYRNDTVNTLRLWKAEPTDELDLAEFNAGSYTEAVAAKTEAENITMVLYPNDVSENGKALRLRQQYFLASASLQDVIATWVKRYGPDFEGFAAAHVFQLNDTHPSCAVPELMRILLDEYRLGWDEAWRITRSCMAYTNHTLLPEALEKWSVGLFRELLPRLLEIIFEINAGLMREVSARWPGDNNKLRAMSIIEEGDVPMVRMAYLAIVGSYSVNGVAELHSRLLTETLFREFHDFWPERFNNKTNGVTPRRWLSHANPRLAGLISDTIGDRWQQDLEALQDLAGHAANETLHAAWREVKHANKLELAQMIRRRNQVQLNPDWLLDVQVKRIHEYKRQLLNLLHVIHLYDRIHRGDGGSLVPRTVLIGGKAAPGYEMAKRIIHLINAVADTIARDPLASQQLNLIFLPDYGVTAMESICPAAELSEQISTAGKEASGTGNMKFMMNGAITIGTLDGANIEIRECCGTENFFEFGMTTEQVEALHGHYDPVGIINQDDDLARVLALIEADHFCLFQPSCFHDIVAAIRNPADPWLVAGDFRDYVDTQAAIEQAYKDQPYWQQMSIMNTATSGWFSSDRTIADYARDIWQVSPVSNQPQR